MSESRVDPDVLGDAPPDERDVRVEVRLELPVSGFTDATGRLELPHRDDLVYGDAGINITTDRGRLFVPYHLVRCVITRIQSSK